MSYQGHSQRQSQGHGDVHGHSPIYAVGTMCQELEAMGWELGAMRYELFLMGMSYAA